MKLKSQQISSVREIEEHHICKINSFLFDRTEMWKECGCYRKIEVGITDTSYKPPTSIEVPNLMYEFVSKLHDLYAQVHTVELAIFAHASLVSIHPFADGNGRTSRLLTNLILLSKGFSPIFIEETQRGMYYDTLRECQVNKNPTNFYHFMVKCLEQTANNYIQIINRCTEKTI